MPAGAFFFSFLRTPVRSRRNLLSLERSFVPCSPYWLSPVSLHRFGVAHQPSLRSVRTMMKYSISLRCVPLDGARTIRSLPQGVNANDRPKPKWQALLSNRLKTQKHPEKDALGADVEALCVKPVVLKLPSTIPTFVIPAFHLSRPCLVLVSLINKQMGIWHEACFVPE